MQAMAGPRNRRVSLMANMKFAPIVEDMKEAVPRKQYSLNPEAPAFTMNADGTYSMITPRAAPQARVLRCGGSAVHGAAAHQAGLLLQQQPGRQRDADAQGSRQRQGIQQLVQTAHGAQETLQGHPYRGPAQRRGGGAGGRHGPGPAGARHPGGARLRVRGRGRGARPEREWRLRPRGGLLLRARLRPGLRRRDQRENALTSAVPRHFPFFQLSTHFNIKQISTFYYSLNLISQSFY